MDRNTLLAFALSMLVFTGYLFWQEQVRGPERLAAIEQAQAQQRIEEARLAAEAADRPAAAQSSPPVARADARRAPEPALPESAKSPANTAPWTGEINGERVRVKLDNRGGVVESWRLADYYETPRSEVNVELLVMPPDIRAAFETPFVELGLGDLGAVRFEVERASPSEVSFVYRADGVVVRKIYSNLDGYSVDLELEIENHSDRILEPRFEVVIPAVEIDKPDFAEGSLIARMDGEVNREAVLGLGSASFFGGLFGGATEDGPVRLEGELDWAGADVRYFTALLIPEAPRDARVVFEPVEGGKAATAHISERPAPLAPGERASRRFSSYVGPKAPELLAVAGRDLDQSISRGFSWIAPLTTFFGWALHSVYKWVPNYGLAIILITLLVRLATWPIMARQMKSAERMRELMPRIKELQEKFKDDRQKQSEETFKLYRETGVNPLGGCLPMVLQLPVFIGLFYALQSSIDLRHAPFFLWINDLSAPATLFTLPGVDFPVRLLPLLMGASMFAQQKMMPQTGMDPAQAKMMLIMMPGMMLVISYSFPSGLVLYWMVSNVLGIAHQLWVRRTMHAEQGES